MNKEFKVYTKTGDNGTTSLIGGTRVKKYDLRLEAYGSVDELTSWVGLIRSADIEEEIRHILEKIQQKLFVIGAILATDEKSLARKRQLPCKEEDITMLEDEIDKISADLPKLSHFVLPGGSVPASYCHVARTVCRRVERRIVELSEKEEINSLVVIYINRLSDYLFVLSRKIALDLKVPETLWIPSKM